MPAALLVGYFRHRPLLRPPPAPVRANLGRLKDDLQVIAASNPKMLNFVAALVHRLAVPYRLEMLRDASESAAHAAAQP